ncbi:hypothetical protein ACOCEA_17900, partial [Maribacter sp. CXY002]|uniref:hypothetical protein n=1 Tax=Maribacter luteocoastalis TaxID=3407671 RepID=UPI003B670C0A
FSMHSLEDLSIEVESKPDLQAVITRNNMKIIFFNIVANGWAMISLRINPAGFVREKSGPVNGLCV